MSMLASYPNFLQTKVMQAVESEFHVRILVLLVCPAAVVKATECDPQLGCHCQDSSHCTITSHDRVRFYNMWQQCLAVLCDVWRSTGRGSGRCGVQHMSILSSHCREESLTPQATTIPTSHLFPVVFLSRCPASYQP